MKLSTLYKLTYIYLALPLLIFILSWLNFAFSSLFLLAFVCAFYMAYPKINTNMEVCSGRTLFMIAIIAAIWCFLSGIGYFYYQSFDYHFRNAVFRDLINYEWPVYYRKANTPLVYYIAFWLVPAAITKFFGLFIADKDSLFMIGNYVLFVYAVSGVMLVLTHILKALDINKTKQALLVILLFIFFSGMDIIGYTYFLIVKQPFDYHLEWWATFIQYSSITTSMMWVFNQFVPTSLITLLMFNERKISNFGLLIVFALFFAPYPCAGIGIFMLAYTGKYFINQANKKDFIKNEILSIPNIVGVFWLLPFVVLYFITNSEGMNGWYYIFSYTTPQRFLLFIVLEFLLYVILLYSDYKKDIFFMTMLFSLLFIPFFGFDMQNNFCMRASIPSIIILCLFVIRFFITPHKTKPFKASLIVIIYLIGIITPLMEFYRGFHAVVEQEKLAIVQDEIYTLDQRYIPMPIFGFDVNHQYTAKTYHTDIFWRYFSKLY